jgi:phosphopentomutase
MIRPGAHFGTRATFADLGQTLADALGVPALEHGISFWPEVLR